jgi:hypothetical protein
MAFSAFGGPSPSSLHRADRVKNAIPVEAARRSEFGHAVGSNSGCSNLISFSDSTVDSNSGRSNLNLLFRFHALGSHLLHACCNYFNSINPQYTRMRAILDTSWALVLMLMSDHLISTTHAAVIAHAVRRDSTVGQPVQPHGLSTEALLTLIGICVAVLGIALAIVQTWPSLKTGWGMCRSRRFQPYQRSRSLYTGMSPDID